MNGTAWKILTVLLGLLLLGTSVGWAVTTWRSNREIDRQNEALSDLVLDLAEKDSLHGTVAEERVHLLAELSDSSTKIGRQAARLAAVRADNVRLVRIAAEAREELGGRGTRLPSDSSRVGPPESAPEDSTPPTPSPDSVLRPGEQVRGHLLGDPHEVWWLFTAPDSIGLDIITRIRLQMLDAVLPDGRLAVWPEALSPNTELQVERFEFQPPEPPRVGWHWPTFLKTAPPAIIFGAFILAVAR